jgi:hypothetical protein
VEELKKTVPAPLVFIIHREHFYMAGFDTFS